jgi:uncharacterized protein YggU (UPF0235/DUF167 family)
MQVVVTVKLRQPASELIVISDAHFIARVTSIPEDNKANNEIVHLLAKQFKVPKSHVRLVRGATSKIKVFEL